MRKLTAIVMLLVLSLVLVSCGTGDDGDAEPTEAPTTVVQSKPTEPADVSLPGTPAIDEGEDTATPVEEAATAVVASPVASTVATPVALSVTHASPVASPVATPVVEASAASSPAASMPMVVPPVSAPAESPVVMIEMSGMVRLNGAENSAYILTDEGCVGLGQYSGLREGRQVVVRNEAGTIVSVTTLESSDASEGCAWDFVVQVPESDFYSVSIPMAFEQVFPKAQVNENNGEVVIELP